MRRSLLLLVLGGALSVLVGCNGSSSDSSSDSYKPSADNPGSNSVDKPGKIDVGPNSPAGTVRRLWRQVEGGSPAMVLKYDPRIRRLVGSTGILTVFSPPPAQFTAQPEIVSVSDTPLGTEVTVRSKPAGSKRPSTSLYLLGKSGQKWLVRFDSNLNTAVQGYVSVQAQNRINAKAKQASPQATAAGNAAAQKLRALFTPGPRRGRLVRR